MSPVLKERRDGSTRPARYRALQPSALIWLVIVWMSLWGEVSVANAVGGLLVAASVSLVFPLPPLRIHLRIRPVALAWLALRFLYDVVVASVQVAWITLTVRELRNAVVEVSLRTLSDLVLTLVAEMTSLVPGSVVIETRRSSHTLFLHVLGVKDAEGVEAAREHVLATERRVVRALGVDALHRETGQEEGEAAR